MTDKTVEEHDDPHIDDMGLCLCTCINCKDIHGICICEDDCWVHYGDWDDGLPDAVDQMTVTFDNEEKK